MAKVAETHFNKYAVKIKSHCEEKSHSLLPIAFAEGREFRTAGTRLIIFPMAKLIRLSHGEAIKLLDLYCACVASLNLRKFDS